MSAMTALLVRPSTQGEHSRKQEMGFGFGYCMLLTALNVLLMSNHPLNDAIPANFLSFERPTSRLIAAPMLNPPRTMRSGGVPESISSVMSWLIWCTERRMPASSSSQSNPKEMMSNLVWARRGGDGLIRAGEDDG